MRKDRSAAQRKAGYNKVQKCCLEAAQDGYPYAWIDSCCIDKRSSAELSEGINTMYKWYQNVQVCYVYLVDVPSSGFDSSPEVDDDALSKSRWFTRGWTLQELIAPWNIWFFAQDWTLIGMKGLQVESSRTASENNPLKDPFLLKLAKITGIGEGALRDPLAIRRTSVAQRMSWAAQRQTTREEDIAYALMGLFGVNMPILYGEGQQKAFNRLQLEIIKSSPDQSIFAWRANRESSGLLAESPLNFTNSCALESLGYNSSTIFHDKYGPLYQFASVEFTGSARGRFRPCCASMLGSSRWRLPEDSDIFETCSACVTSGIGETNLQEGTMQYVRASWPVI